MERRSTGDFYVHFSGDIVSNVESSHGVILSGRSTGGVIEAFGDDTNVSLTVRAKNAGILTLGTSSGDVSIASAGLAATSTRVEIISTTVQLGSTSAGVTGGIYMASSRVFLNSTRFELGAASTTPIELFQRVRVDFTVPEIAANATGTSTHTATGLTTNSVMFFNSDALAAGWPDTVIITAKCSTADELRLLYHNHAASSIGTGLSSQHGYLGWFAF